MAFDPELGKIVMFGGVLPGDQHSDETWTWDGATWEQLDLSNRPTIRSDARLVHDPVRGELVLFGDDSQQARTWTFDDGAWERRDPPTSPPVRSGMTMGFDPHSAKIIMTGGWPPWGVALDDTWAWNGSTWKELEGAGTLTHCCGMAAYDPTRQSLVAFGGGVQHTYPVSEAWRWTGSRWVKLQKFDRPPTKRWHPSVATLGDHLAVFGGGVRNAQLNTTWILLADSWKRIRSTPHPSRRQNAAFAWDPVREEAVLFGGWSYQKPFMGDTWTLSMNDLD